MLSGLKKYIKKRGLEWMLKVDNESDGKFLAPDVPLPQLVEHSKWQEFVYNMGNQEGLRVLEIGSREVTAPSVAKQFMPKADYVGFDFYAGKNVDVVGDVHKLSSYFEEDEKFDLIFSSACFEHFAMPWIAATEIAKMLKVGGHVFVETHFSYSSHERPWNFFQFSDMGLRTLFSPALGFECVDSGMSNPMVGRFSIHATPYLRNQKITGLYCHSEFLGKKIKEVENFSWENVDIQELVGDTRYPDPT